MKQWSIIAFISLVTCGQLSGQDEEKQVYHDFELELEFEYRYFYKEGQFPGQQDHFPSLAVRPKYSVEWEDGYQSFNVLLFYRLDRDDFRTRGDIRELYYQKAKGNWEFNFGLKKIFWGVTESSHLVDIINQTDGVESFDGEQKLGQPMAQIVWRSEKLGTFSFFYLPYHRKRTFPGEKGRFRFPVVIDPDDLGYESGAEEWRQDFSLRWTNYFGIADVGLSYFHGNGREPFFLFTTDDLIDIFYPVIHQGGLDLQITHNAFLWKLESIYRYASVQEFFALVGGLEYTFSNINGNGLDIGLLGEYHYDSRDELTLSGLQNDFFFGSRIAFNDIQDTAILFGGIADLETSSKIFSLEASRRFGSSWTAEIEARIFSDIDENEIILSNFSEDSFIRIAISKYF